MNNLEALIRRGWVERVLEDPQMGLARYAIWCQLIHQRKIDEQHEKTLKRLEFQKRPENSLGRSLIGFTFTPEPGWSPTPPISPETFFSIFGFPTSEPPPSAENIGKPFKPPSASDFVNRPEPPATA